MGIYRDRHFRRFVSGPNHNCYCLVGKLSEFQDVVFKRLELGLLP